MGGASGVFPADALELDVGSAVVRFLWLVTGGGAVWDPGEPGSLSSLSKAEIYAGGRA